MNPDDLKELREGFRGLIPAAIVGFVLWLGLLASVVLAIRFLVNGTLP